MPRGMNHLKIAAEHDENGAAQPKHEAPDGVDSYLPTTIRPEERKKMSDENERRKRIAKKQERELLRQDLASGWDIDYNPNPGRRQIFHIPKPPGRNKV